MWLPLRGHCYVDLVADAHDPFPACDVCGRTILKGEQIYEYLTPQRERIRVCVLCRSRAESSGWLPVSMAHTLEEEQPRSRGLALRERFGRAASRARSATWQRRVPERDQEPEYEAPPDEVDRPPAAEPQAAPEAAEQPQPEPAPEPEPTAEAGPEHKEEATPAKRAAKPQARRQTRARTAKRGAKRTQERARPPRGTRAKRGPEALMRRAVERFNSSEERRKVAGLMRSLGEPQAGVRPDPRRQLALVTVAWELSWYQWEVGADGDGDEPVREVAKGAEVSELDEEARAWNAAVDEDGTLRLRSAAERQRQEAANEA
jgi:hypothetical protein